MDIRLPLIIRHENWKDRLNKYSSFDWPTVIADKTYLPPCILIETFCRTVPHREPRLANTKLVTLKNQGQFSIKKKYFLLLKFK